MYDGKPVAIGIADTDVFECPVSEQAVIVPVVSNNSATAKTWSLKFYKAEDATTITIGNAVSLNPNLPPVKLAPLAMEAGDKLIMVASAAPGIVCAPFVDRSGAPGAAAGFTPRGEYSGVATYAKNDLVRVAADGKTYVSRVDGNIGNTPVSSPTQWMLYVSDGAQGPPGDLDVADIGVT